MKKTAIFEDVVSIMTHDSSTIKDRKGCDPEPFRENITDDMTDDAFLYQVKAYLASFGVIGHISFRDKKASQKGFLLRINGQKLYVEEANEDTGLQVGDQILGLDGSDLDQIASLHKDYFISKNPERHYREWADLVSQSTSVTLLREGIEKSIEVVPSREPIQDHIFWKRLDDEILYLRLDNFMDERAISRVYQECLPMMTEIKFLLIDVRRNSGGTDSLYIPLLHLGLEKDQGYEGIDWDDDGMEILYTERNVDLRLKDFENWMQQEEISPETVKLLEDMKEDLIHHRGKAMYRISKKARNSSQRLEVATILNRSLSYQIFIVLLLEIISSI
ncbi:TSPc, tail specific protease [Streptococcus sp. ZB199]|nr:TSPc, tail specific protease [Streptococcus sp. ZB199]